MSTVITLTLTLLKELNEYLVKVIRKWAGALLAGYAPLWLLSRKKFIPTSPFLLTCKGLARTAHEFQNNKVPRKTNPILCYQTVLKPTSLICQTFLVLIQIQLACWSLSCLRRQSEATKRN